MTALVPITGVKRATIFKAALKIANKRLSDHDLTVRFFAQWPFKKDVDSKDPDAFDSRPNIDLEMLVNRRWYRIDIVYMRQMPIEPERLKSPADLAQAIYDKAIEHFLAMSNPNIFISATGSKYDMTDVGKDTFFIDKQGYMRVSNMRVIRPKGDKVDPIKDSTFRSHTVMRLVKMPDNTLVLSDLFDTIRTDNRSGGYMLRQRPIDVPLESICDDRQEDAAKYGDRYVVMVRNREGIERFFSDPDSYLRDPASYIPKVKQGLLCAEAALGKK